MISVTVVVENTSADPKTLPPRHGLCLLIEIGETRLLYDFGPKGALVRNSRAMGIDLTSIDMAFLSHSHIDHGSGINDFFAVNSQASVYAMNTVGTDFYTSLAGIFQIPIGIKILPKYKDRVCIETKTTAITDRIHLVDFTTYENASSINKTLLGRKNGSLVQDDFGHESILVIVDAQELTVFNACSHHGVIKSLERVSESFPGKRIRSYIGGFHTYNPVTGKHENQQKLVALGRSMSKWDCAFYTGHCTGDFAFRVLSPILGNKLQAMCTGKSILA